MLAFDLEGRLCSAFLDGRRTYVRGVSVRVMGPTMVRDAVDELLD